MYTNYLKESSTEKRVQYLWESADKLSQSKYDQLEKFVDDQKNIARIEGKKRAEEIDGYKNKFHSILKLEDQEALHQAYTPEYKEWNYGENLAWQM